MCNLFTKKGNKKKLKIFSNTLIVVVSHDKWILICFENLIQSHTLTLTLITFSHQHVIVDGGGSGGGYNNNCLSHVIENSQKQWPWGLILNKWAFAVVCL